MIKKVLTRLFLGIVIITLAAGCVGCKKEEKPQPQEKKEVKEEKEEKIGELAEYKIPNFDFTIKLLQVTYNVRQNSVVAPISSQMALGVAMNGAKSSTQQCLIKTFGMETIVFNEYMKTYIDSLKDDKGNGVEYANSLWFNNISGGIEINSNFESRVKQYLNTELELLAFNKYTKETLNTWIGDKTDKFLDSLYTRTNVTDIMYMMNAAHCNLNWEKSYSANDIVPGKFININRTVSNVEMMKSVESLYIEDNDVTGFIKNFAGNRYQFVAILPDSTTNVFLYLRGLSADKLDRLLSSAKQENVNVTMPKFTGLKIQNMRVPYAKMGLSELFADMANYTGILKSEANLALGLVLQKSKVEIGKTGAQGAGISTISSTTTIKEASRDVILNRPFIYLIYDSYQCMPIFAGVQQNM